MDSPLNRAHQWARKADSLTVAGKFEEAIMCHNRAAENMLETLQGPVLSDNPSLVSCLRLQHEHHLRQVKVLQGKQLRQSNIEARKGRPVKMRSKSIQTESLNSLPHRATGVRHQNVLVNTQDIQESIRDADTMLRFLKLRKDDPELPLPWEEYGLGGDKVETSAPTDVASGAVKKPKDEKVIVEELRCLTEELREHIMLLVRESEWLKVENQDLSRQLAELQKLDSQDRFVNELIPIGTHFSNSSSINLPPLEMPQIQLPPKLSSDSEDDLSDRI